MSFFKKFSQERALKLSLGLIWLTISCTPQGPLKSSSTIVKPQSFAAPAFVKTPVDSTVAALNPAITKSDWSSDRILSNVPGFKTQAFSDSLRPQLNLPALRATPKTPPNSNEFVNEFAKTISHDMDNGMPLPGSPAYITATDTAYFLTGSETLSNFYGLSSAGDVRWQLSLHDNNGKFVGTSPANGSAGGLNVLYVANDVGRLYAVNADTGIVISFIDASSDGFEYTSPFVIAGATDNIYLASKKGKVYKYTFNGSAFTSVYSTAVLSGNLGKFSSSPLVTGLTKSIYVGSDEGKFYKLEEGNNATTRSTLELNTLTRSERCQIKGTPAIDSSADVAIVPCGAYLFKVRLNDASTSTNMAFAAQSPLLELKTPQVFKTPRVTGPNHFYRPIPITRIKASGETKPSEKDFAVEQPFGFGSGDYVQVTFNRTGASAFESIDKIDKDKITLLDKMVPLPSPSPDPFFSNLDVVTTSNLVARKSPAPIPSTTPTPAPVNGGDPVTQFTVGSAKDLKEGDILYFPSLPVGSQVYNICSSTNTNCENDLVASPTTKYAGIAIVDLKKGLTTITVEGATLAPLLHARLATNSIVPFERLKNHVIGTANTNSVFQVADITGFQAGNLIRLTHQSGSSLGRYEYAIIGSIAGNTITLSASTPLLNTPATADVVDIMEQSTALFGRVLPVDAYSGANILSSPVLRGNSQHVYVQHNNLIFELDYSDDNNFRNTANYLVLQSGRLEGANRPLADASRSTPVIVDGNKLLALDTSPTGTTGIYINRVRLPLSTTVDKLNDTFAVALPNAQGGLPSRAETRPVQLGTSAFVLFSGGNGVVYKLHKDITW